MSKTWLITGCSSGFDAVLAEAMLGQDVDKEATDGLLGGKRHNLLPVGASAAMVLMEGDAGLFEAEAWASIKDFRLQEELDRAVGSDGSYNPTIEFPP